MRPVIFIHIPKTGGVSIFHALKAAGAMISGYGNCHKTIEEKIKKKNAPILGVVRSPYDRIHSIYDFYLKAKLGIHGQVLLNGARGPSFKEFIESFETKYFNKAVHFTTCFNYLKKGDAIGVTDILRFETLQQDFEAVCKKYDITATLKHLNQNPHRDKNIDKDQMFKHNMRQIIEQCFADDFKHFGYSWESYLEGK